MRRKRKLTRKDKRKLAIIIYRQLTGIVSGFYTYIVNTTGNGLKSTDGSLIIK